MEHSKEAHKNKLASRASLAIDARDGVARYDMACGLASMARPLKKGAIRFEYKVKQTWVQADLAMSGLELSDYDLGVLLALIVVAERQKPELQLGSKINNLLPNIEEENLAEGLDVVTVNTNFSEIKKILGVTSGNGNTNDTIWESLKYLAMTIIDVKQGKQRAITHLIGYGKGLDDSLSVCLSYRLTKALMGKGSYASIRMSTFNSLPKGTARILYVWLASWFAGSFGTRTVRINTLVENVWGKKIQKITQNEMKERRRTIRNALTNIATISNEWGVEIVEDIAIVERKR